MEQNVKCEIVNVTPDIAKAYLTHNTGNRPISRRDVAMYAKQMQEGLWRLTTDAIGFAENGRLINGQHRLTAVVESGVTCPFIVAHNYDENAFEVIDIPNARKVGDALYSRGVVNYNNIGAVTKRKMLLDDYKTAISDNTSSNGSFKPGSRNKIALSFQLREYYQHQSEYDKIVQRARFINSKSKILTAGDIGGYIAYLTLSLHHPFETAVEFFEEFADIKPITNNVISLLRQRLTMDRISQYKMTATARQKLVIKAWNAFLTGKTLKVLAYNEAKEGSLWFV